MTTQCATETKPCCTCGGEGMQGHPEARYDEADAYDVCYHCGGTGTVDSKCCEPTVTVVVPGNVAAIVAKAAAGAKFTNDEVTKELADLAKAYLTAYTGSFDFVFSIKASFEQYGGLRTAQVRGVLNCMVSDAKRNAAPVPALPAVPALAVRDGLFTVVLEGGVRRTIRVRHGQIGEANKLKQFVSFLSGSNNDADYTLCGLIVEGGFRWVSNYGRTLTADAPLRQAVEFVLHMNDDERREAGKAYALESGNCYVCNRTLTEPESIELGIGPICRGREGM